MLKHEFIYSRTGLPEKSIKNVLILLEDGATIPFISRYRKEMTGSIDEVQIANIRDEGKRFDDLISRQQTILSSIEEQGKLNDDLKKLIESCFDQKSIQN